METRAVLIAGPTASGKSALAVALAERRRGVVINADSMQLYADLAILTARPTAEEQRGVPHRLFGVRDAAQPCSAADWAAMATAEIENAWREDRLPILVGGTGLYFRALLEGLADIPEIPGEIRERTRRELLEAGAPSLHRKLAEVDPVMAARLEPGDGQRIARALEVIRATGRSLAFYQAERCPGGLAAAERAGRVVKAVLEMPRATLARQAGRRFHRMLDAGALEEARRLADRGLDPELPAMKALGAPALMRYLRGEISRKAAIEEAVRQTRRYIKRQQTWMATQFPGWPRYDAADPDGALAALERALDDIDTAKKEQA